MDETFKLSFIFELANLQSLVLAFYQQLLRFAQDISEIHLLLMLIFLHI